MRYVNSIQTVADSIAYNLGLGRSVDVTPLVEREQAIAANLIERAVGLGLAETDARQLLASAGMNVAPLPRPAAPRATTPPPAPTGSPADLIQQASSLLASAAAALR